MIKVNNVSRPILFCAAMLVVLGKFYGILVMYRKVTIETSVNIDFFTIYTIMAELIIFIIFFLYEKNIYWRIGFSFYLSSCTILFMAKILSNTSITIAVLLCYFSAFLLIPALYCFINFVRERV
jgi:hypothetical protein